MNEQIHLLLDGDLTDTETIDFLRTLVASGEDRAYFREQMKLQGALYRNDGHESMSSSEEAEMLSRVSNAIDLPKRGSGFRAGTWAIVASAFLIGSGVGYAGYSTLSGSTIHSAPPSSITTASAPIPVTPCNCDSAAAMAAGAVRDSVSRASKLATGTITRRSISAGRQRHFDDDPTGRKKAQQIARSKNLAPEQ